MPFGRRGIGGWARELVMVLATLACALLVSPLAAARMVGRSTPRIAPLTPSSPVTRGSTYLALGDSVTFGYQEPSVMPAPNYKLAATFRGYPLQIGTELHLKAVDPACPGETSASLINVTAPSNGCENAYRKLYPLHVRYSGSQLSFAVAYLKTHPQVRLVSLMIGANDLFLCQRETPDHCTNPATFKAHLNTISANVRRILSAVRNRGRYSGQIVIENYYSLDYAVPLVNQESTALNAAQDSAAKPFHVRIADGYGEFRTASTKFANNPCLAGLLTQTGGYGSCGVHPTFAGQTLLAKALITAARLP